MRWTYDSFKDGAIIDFTLADGESFAVVLTEDMLFLLLDYLEQIVNHGDLIDLREFRKKSISEMETEVADSAGYRLVARFDHFEVSLRLLEKNWSELTQHLARFTGRITDADLVHWVRRHHVTVFMEEVVRLLHNYLAACATLIDLARILYEELYQPSGGFPDYKKEVDRRFGSDPLSQFIRKLRNFILHRGIPPVTTTKSFGADGIKGGVYLRKKELLLFSGWNAKAKEFLESQPESVDLLQVVNDYHRKVVNFYSWVREQRGRIHYREMREAELKRQALFAKRSAQVVASIRSKLGISRSFSDAKVIEIVSELLSAEEVHRLRHHEASRSDWVKLALDLGRKRYLLPADLVADLMALEATSYD